MKINGFRKHDFVRLSLLHILKILYGQLKVWENVNKYKTEQSSSNPNKDRLGRERTERTQENIHLQGNRIVYSRISVRKNCLNISKSNGDRITKRDMKWHHYTMHVKKKKNYK